MRSQTRILRNVLPYLFSLPTVSDLVFNPSPLQSLLALAIVIYTAVKLSDVNVNISGVFGQADTLSEGFCALGTGGGINATVGDANFDFSSADIANSNCLFLEILGGITIGIGIVIGIIQCFTCNICGLGGLLDFIFALAGTAAWLAAAIIIQNVYNDNKDSPLPAIQEYNSERETIMIMCWVEFALFAFIVLASILKCCGGRKKS